MGMARRQTVKNSGLVALPSERVYTLESNGCQRVAAFN